MHVYPSGSPLPVATNATRIFASPDPPLLDGRVLISTGELNSVKIVSTRAEIQLHSASAQLDYARVLCTQDGAFCRRRNRPHNTRSSFCNSYNEPRPNRAKQAQSVRDQSSYLRDAEKKKRWNSILVGSVGCNSLLLRD